MILSGVQHPRALVIRGASLGEWAIVLGLSSQALSWRIRRWGVERALSRERRANTCSWCESERHNSRRCPVRAQEMELT